MVTRDWSLSVDDVLMKYRGERVTAFPVAILVSGKKGTITRPAVGMRGTEKRVRLNEHSRSGGTGTAVDVQRRDGSHFSLRLVANIE